MNNSTESGNQNMSDQQNDPQQSMHFEQALNELQNVVKNLNQPELSLDDALKFYERGVHLAQHGRSLLAQAEQKIENLRGSLGGNHESGS